MLGFASIWIISETQEGNLRTWFDNHFAFYIQMTLYQGVWLERWRIFPIIGWWSFHTHDV